MNKLDESHRSILGPYLLIIALLALFVIGAACEIRALTESNVRLAEENEYLSSHCMVFGEQGDILVPIEVLESD